MKVTKDTIVYDILSKYGDIADVLETFDVKSFGPFNIRRIITRFLTVEKAAKLHKEPLDGFIEKINKAIATKTAQ